MFVETKLHFSRKGLQLLLLSFFHSYIPKCERILSESLKFLRVHWIWERWRCTVCKI